MKLSVEKLNRFLVCSLCNGYFSDAHTIPECLHTFCKECLVQRFEEVARVCPTCGLALGPNAEHKIVYDRNMQSCVDKVFPDFLRRDSNRLALAPTHAVADIISIPQIDHVPIGSDATAEEAEEEMAWDPEQVNIRLTPVSNASKTERLPPLKRMVLKTSLQTRVHKIQSYIRRRLLEDNYNADAADILILFGRSLLLLRLHVSNTLSVVYYQHFFVNQNLTYYYPNTTHHTPHRKQVRGGR